MLRQIKRLATAAAFIGVFSGCIVAARPVAPCPGAIWVEGHYDRRGRWHREHWRCPGVIEEEVIIR